MVRSKPHCFQCWQLARDPRMCAKYEQVRMKQLGGLALPLYRNLLDKLININIAEDILRSYADCDIVKPEELPKMMGTIFSSNMNGKVARCAENHFCAMSKVERRPRIDI